MKLWNDKGSNIGRYVLFLGEDAHESAVLYCENSNGEDTYNYTVFDGGAAYVHKPLKAKNLEEAKLEVEAFLNMLYNTGICNGERTIKFYRQKLKCLNSSEIGLV